MIYAGLSLPLRLKDNRGKNSKGASIHVIPGLAGESIFFFKMVYKNYGASYENRCRYGRTRGSNPLVRS
jgi:hypothetical protein